MNEASQQQLFGAMAFDRREKGVAQVQVKASRNIDGFERELLYTYYLTADGNFWKITGLESRILQ